MKTEDIRLGKRIFFADTIDEIKNAIVTKMEQMENGDICITITCDKKQGGFTAHKDDEIGIRIFDVRNKNEYTSGKCCVAFQPLKEWMLADLRENKEEMINRIDGYIEKVEALKEEDL